jgi:diacylglycerol kinase family enzyme
MCHCTFGNIIAVGGDGTIGKSVAESLENVDVVFGNTPQVPS